GVPDEIRGQFRRDQLGLGHPGRTGTQVVAVPRDRAPDDPRVGTVGRGEHLVGGLPQRFHWMITTVVPRPGPVSMENSSTSRRLPGRPSPRLPAVLNPSRMASSRFAMPGPSSLNTARIPHRPPPPVCSIDTFPWPWTAYRTMLRASSLPPVISFVAAVRPSPACCA